MSKGSSGGFEFGTKPFYGVIPSDHVLYCVHDAKPNTVGSHGNH